MFCCLDMWSTFELISDLNGVLRLWICLLSTGWSAAADENQAHEQEYDDRRKLQNGHPEFFFCVSHDTKQADDADSNEEYDDPDGDVYFSSPAPPLDCEASNN